MSIIRSVVRLCSIAALRGQTFAQDRVYDSDNTSLVEAVRASSVPLPYIVCYTDLDNRPTVGDMDVYGAARQLSLVIEIAMASGLKDDGLTIDLPHTDAAMELAIDLVETQAVRALFGDPHNEWGEYLKRMIISVARVNSPRGGRAQAGVRFAMRQATFVLDTIADVPAGVPFSEHHVVRDFITRGLALPGTNDMHHAADTINAVIGGTAYASYEQDQAWLGLTRAGMQATGMAPLTDAGDGGSQIIPVESGSAIVDPLIGGGPELGTISLEQEDKGNELAEIAPEPPP